MRYILNDSGYIETISFNYMVECNNKLCTEYTGTIPIGYETLSEWSENANINAYKIVDGNLVFDSEEDARLQSLWASQQVNVGITGDTLPIGSEVDYNGDTVPTGWEKIDNPDDYSTEETFTGKYWIDGKKIYRKVITDITSTGTKKHNISNFGEIINFYGQITKSTGKQESIPRTVLSNPEVYGIAVGDFSTTGFYIEFGSNYINVQKGVLTLEYTKTAD